MKKKFHILSVILIISTLAFFTADSCRKMAATGWCTMFCTCDDPPCKKELTFTLVTKRECEEFKGTQFPVLDSCNCECTNVWVEREK